MGNDLQRQWGRNIATRRKDLKLSQQGLADELTRVLGSPVTQQAVSFWESGVYAPRDRNRSALAQVLHLDVHTLFPLPRTVEAAS